MQISNNSSLNHKYNTSFGMAKLTAKGSELATDIMGQSPFLFNDTKVCKKKNLLKKLIKNVKKGKSQANEFTTFFETGNSSYALINSLFIKKQVLPLGGRRTIKHFLKYDNKKALAALGDPSIKDTTRLTDDGSTLLGEIVKLFDKNISNELISARKSRKILNIIKPYASNETLSQRIALVSDRFYSK